MSFDLIGKAVKVLKLPTVNYGGSNIQVIPAQQGDTNSRFFEIVLYDDRGNINLDKYTHIVLNATLPDGSKQQSESKKDKSKIICKISASMLSITGRIACEVALSGKDDSEENIYLTSQTFYVIATESQYNNDIVVGDDNYNEILMLMRQVINLDKTITTNEESRKSAEIIRVNNESSRELGEANREDQFIISQTNREETFLNEKTSRETRFISEQEVRSLNFDNEVSDRVGKFAEEQKSRESYFTTEQLTREENFLISQEERAINFSTEKNERNLRFDEEQTNRASDYSTEQAYREERFISAQDDKECRFMATQNEREVIFTEAEMARQAAEETRIITEAKRIVDENNREQAEVLRSEAFFSAQNERKGAFNYEQTDRESKFEIEQNTREESFINEQIDRENKFGIGEITRQATFEENEQLRQNAENQRVSNETIRIDNENTRKNNEVARTSNEDDRETNETTRQIQENTRILAEQERGGVFNTAIGACEQATQDTLDTIQQLLESGGTVIDINGIRQRTTSFSADPQTQIDLLTEAKENIANKNVAGGYAGLDENGKIPLCQISDAILGQLRNAGEWDANSGVATLTTAGKVILGTNLPTITLTNNTADITGYLVNQNNYYLTTVAGIFSNISFSVGDWLVSNSSGWSKIDNTDAVSSVAGKTGNVILNKDDVGLTKVNNTSDLDKPISTATQIVLDSKVDKIEGKQLSTEDYTNSEKNKLAGIAQGAQVNSVTGIKGDKETVYRIGEVNITKSNIGLDNVDNIKQFSVDNPPNIFKGDDTRGENQPPSWYMSLGSTVIKNEFKNCETIGVSNIVSGMFCNLTTFNPWSDASGGFPVQIATSNTSSGIQAIRSGISAIEWGAWAKVYTSANKPTPAEIGALYANGNAASASLTTLRPMTSNLHDWLPVGQSIGGGLFVGEGINITNAPTNGWWRYLGMRHNNVSNSASYFMILAFPLNEYPHSANNRILQKSCVDSQWTGWTEYANKDDLDNKLDSSTSGKLISTDAVINADWTNLDKTLFNSIFGANWWTVLGTYNCRGQSNASTNEWGFVATYNISFHVWLSGFYFIRLSDNDTGGIAVIGSVPTDIINVAGVLGKTYTTKFKPTPADIGALYANGNAASANLTVLRPMTPDLHNWIPFGSSGMYVGEGQNITNAPNQLWWRYIGISHNNPAGFVTLLAFPLNTDNYSSNKIFQKSCVSGVWTGWTEYASKDDLVASLANYLPLKGGVIEGNLTMNSKPIQLIPPAWDGGWASGIIGLSPDKTPKFAFYYVGQGYSENVAPHTLGFGIADGNEFYVPKRKVEITGDTIKLENKYINAIGELQEGGKRAYSENYLPTIIKDSNDGRKIGINYSGNALSSAGWLAGFNAVNDIRDPDGKTPVGGAAAEIRAISPATLPISTATQIALNDKLSLSGGRIDGPVHIQPNIAGFREGVRIGKLNGFSFVTVGCDDTTSGQAEGQFMAGKIAASSDRYCIAHSMGQYNNLNFVASFGKNGEIYDQNQRVYSPNNPPPSSGGQSAWKVLMPSIWDTVAELPRDAFETFKFIVVDYSSGERIVIPTINFYGTAVVNIYKLGYGWVDMIKLQWGDDGSGYIYFFNDTMTLIQGTQNTSHPTGLMINIFGIN